MTAKALQSLVVALQLVSAVSDDATTATVKTIFDSSDGMDINGVVLAIGALLVGALLAVAGYRLWQTTVYALGFLGGGVVIAAIFEKVFKDETWVLTASWIAFVVGGIVVGYVCVYLFWAGIFMAGAVAVAVFAVVGGAVALWLQKPALIAGTSMTGAFLLFWGIGYFAGNYPTFNDLERFRVYNSSGDLVYSIPGAWWGYLIGTLVVFGLSVVLQFRFTGKDVDYHTLDRRGSEDELPRHAAMTPARVQYVNMGTPGVQQYEPQPQQQRYPTSNQVRWEDLQGQQPPSERTGSSSMYADTSLVQPQYQQRDHEYQISDIIPTTARPEYSVGPATAPSAPQTYQPYQGSLRNTSGTSHVV
ncbi:hypothetical protein PF004_g14539 [Phytophthora fragariae]|uniref:Transmembrane protein 198 n=1 Tax=Phytophthora fragariae TaxID=53985 RepID=A0A6G0NP16_9STRA|nr:hypothetical protein PF004_g14539 [Phytophthora fragariae]